MPRLTIDGRTVEVPPGTTVLEAARRAGIEIPTLCHHEGLPPQTSCFVCVVRVKGTPSLLPSCATEVYEGMEVESETEEVHRARRTALELLLSDHAGDCIAPCELVCPAHMNIARMNHQIAAGDFAGALITVKRDIALPAVLGRICPAPCEKGCRRRLCDEAVSICLLKRFVADVDLANEDPYLPAKPPPTGKKVAVIGAGPAGLSAAYYTLLFGHACTIFEARDKPGGALTSSIPPEILPPEVLQAEVDCIVRLGAEFRFGCTVGKDIAFEEIKKNFDAVFVAVGPLGSEADGFGLPTTGRGIAVKPRTFQTEDVQVFAGGAAVSPGRLAVRSVGQGKEAAWSINQFLQGREVTGAPRLFTSRLGRPSEKELQAFLQEGAATSRLEPSGGTQSGFSPQEAVKEAQRCLHCDCRKPSSCKLRRYAQAYGAVQNRFKGERRAFEQYRQQAGVVYEPGKCISCGLCVAVTERNLEPLGLTFVGRGFSVRIGVPFNEEISKALTKTASECVAVCPTGALAFLSAPPEPDRDL